MRKTEIVTPDNITFCTRNRIHTDPSTFTSAETVSITVVNKKNENNFEAATQRHNHHILHSPVTIWTDIYFCANGLSRSSHLTPINQFFNKLTERVDGITSDQIPASIRWTAKDLGFKRLGYHPHKVGCHSIDRGP